MNRNEVSGLGGTNGQASGTTRKRMAKALYEVALALVLSVAAYAAAACHCYGDKVAKGREGAVNAVAVNGVGSLTVTA